jgi:hypothetical protein
MRKIGVGLVLAVVVFVTLAGVALAQGPYGWAGYYYPYPAYNYAYADGFYDGYQTGYYWGYYEGYRDGYSTSSYGALYNGTAPVVYSYAGGPYHGQHFLYGTPYVTQCQAYGAQYPGGVCQ